VKEKGNNRANKATFVSNKSYTFVNPALEKRIFSSCDLQLLPMTLTYEHDLGSLKVNRHTEQLGQRLFCVKVIMRTQTDTHRSASALAGPRNGQ